ncbi:hypothetical protein [Methylomagnum ishizawai]|uniref:hypothetical protein n=1 Tax=Methylomagnum ishizawai TaxID=1760988 RepID=UPI001C341705|nr:hypothetical protein [Methylomagnum ishizawai]BBL74020.1 hypothetical protein MishRS11D_11180 [Methylomagnum ishizawai]
MNAQVSEEKDLFWGYVALVTTLLVVVVAMVKLSENDKYDPIRQQQAEETAQMNIRVIH